MIKKHSDDPNVAEAADHAVGIIRDVLSGLPKADSFDYGGQRLSLGEYDVCVTCTTPIAEAQQADDALRGRADTIEDAVIKEHIRLAAQLFEHEAYAATIRAEFHNGQNTEPILNELLGFLYDRHVRDDYTHNHQQASAK
jgi:hypothetical protein